MLDLLRRNGLLLAIFVATGGLYFIVTRPAGERNRKLAELDRCQAEQVHQLRAEAIRMLMQVRALEAGDTALLERAVRGRFQPGGDKTGLPPAQGPTVTAEPARGPSEP